MHIQGINKIFIGLLVLSTGFFPACKEKEPPPPPPAPAPAKVEPPPAPEQPKEKPVYVYSGDRFRDPFTPAGTSTNYQPDAVFDPQRATVRGIIYGASLQSAVLLVGGTGTYFVRGSRIFDVMGKNVEGYTAKIFKDKVNVIGDADTVYELKMQSEEGKEL